MAIYTDRIHLVADTLEELHLFAESIGLKPWWFQDHPEHPHYDLIGHMIKGKALHAGAELVSRKKVLEVSKQLASQLNDYRKRGLTRDSSTIQSMIVAIQRFADLYGKGNVCPHHVGLDGGKACKQEGLITKQPCVDCWTLAVDESLTNEAQAFTAKVARHMIRKNNSKGVR